MMRGKWHARNARETLEQKLARNLQEFREGKTTEVLPITEGYLASLEGDEALEKFIDKQTAKRKAEETNENSPSEKDSE